MTQKFYLPSKVSSYLKRLLGQYKVDKEHEYVELLSLAKFYVMEGVDYDNYGGGVYGHNVKFFLPLEQIAELVPINKQAKIADKLRDDLRACSGSFPGEYFQEVLFEVDEEHDSECQQANYLSNKPIPTKENLSIWASGCIRLFISHRDDHKAEARELSDLLSAYGISAFVAHETIGPLKKWQKVIMTGLETMEIMLAFVTDDFHESVWTNQEIGYALARNIPIISLKLQRTDPKGFIADTQAMKGSLTDLPSIVDELYTLLAHELGNQARMQTALIEAFADSPEWRETTSRFNRLNKHVKALSDVEVGRIVSAFEENDQLHTANYLTNGHDRLKKFLNKSTNSSFTIRGKHIISEEAEEDIPF